MRAMAPAGMEVSCTTGGCKIVTPAMELAPALQYMMFHKEDHHTQKQQDLWIANWILQSHKTRASHVAPVRQVKDSEQEVSTKPAQKEGLISPKDTAMPVGSVKAEQLSNRVALKCDNCNFITSTLRPSKAKKRLASHVHGGHCTTDTRQEYVNEIPHGDGMPTTMVSHQVLHHEDPYKGEVVSTMASHQVPQYEDHYKGEMFPTMASHQVLYYEDHYKGEEGTPQDRYKDPKQECGVASQ